MRIVGIFHTGIATFDQGQAYTLLTTMQIAQDRPNVVNQIVLRLADDCQVAVERITRCFIVQGAGINRFLVCRDDS